MADNVLQQTSPSLKYILSTMNISDNVYSRSK